MSKAQKVTFILVTIALALNAIVLVGGIVKLNGSSNGNKNAVVSAEVQPVETQAPVVQSMDAHKETTTNDNIKYRTPELLYEITEEDKEDVDLYKDIPYYELGGAIKYPSEFKSISEQIYTSISDALVEKDLTTKAQRMLGVTNLLDRDSALSFVADISEVFTDNRWDIEYATLDTQRYEDEGIVSWYLILRPNDSTLNVKVIKFVLTYEKVLSYSVM